MARTWRHVDEGGPAPRELELLRLGDRFGFVAVYGRTLRAREVMALQIVEAIVTGYASRGAAENWATWARENKQLNALLIQAQKESDADH